MMTISYEIGNKLYLNITNKCPCSCTFCIRQNGDGAYGSDSLWLEHQPTAAEVIENLKGRDLDKYEEIIFCGYGEPTNEFSLLLQACDYIRSVSKTPTRLNTNGLADKLNPEYGGCAKELCGRIDTVSISLNSPYRDGYMAVTRPVYDDAFDAMLSFAKSCKGYVPSVMMTVVDVIPKEDIEASQKLCDEIGVTLRVRPYES